MMNGTVCHSVTLSHEKALLGCQEGDLFINTRFSNKIYSWGPPIGLRDAWLAFFPAWMRENEKISAWMRKMASMRDAWKA